MKKLFHFIDKKLELYLNFLCNICAIEAKAENKQTIDEMIDYIVEFSEAEGFKINRTKMEHCGDFLSIDLNEGAEKGCVFLSSH